MKGQGPLNTASGTTAPRAYDISSRRPSLAEIAWVGVPFLLYLLVLQHLWFNAPVWDDYDTILGLLIRADEIRTPGEWLAMVFGQHNEHRIAVTRLVALGLASFGPIDFRVLMLVGNLAVLGTFLFIWREFRGHVPPGAIGAAAIVMFQWSYYEASLMGSAALPHLGVVFFSFGCLHFALRDHPAAIALGVLMGILAAASQANGLLALPIAALGCAFLRRRWQAAIFGAVALAAWILYFRGYVRPPHHPSLLAALSSPVTAVHLFLVVVGWVLPVGALIVAGLGWLTWKGFWKNHPVAALWTLFLLGTAAAATVGRAGFGVVHASRYAIGSTCLLVIVCLAICEVTRWHSRKWMAFAVAGAAFFSITVSLVSWQRARDSTLRGSSLKQPVIEGEAVAADWMGGAYYPDPARARNVLNIAAERGYYKPPKENVHPARVASEETMPEAARAVGHIDSVAVSGKRVSVTGWTDITARVPSRTLRVVSAPRFVQAGSVEIVSRSDVVFVLRDPDLLFSGFRLELEYPSAEDARKGASNLCMVVEAPSRPKTRLAARQPACGAKG